MKPERHRELAENIERSLQHCGATDWEMKIEGAMLAGTHWANFALHRYGVSTESEDIIHTSMLVVNILRKYSLVEERMMQALAEIEELRPLYVRGDALGGAEAGEHALALLQEIGDLARARRDALDLGVAAAEGWRHG